MILAAMPLLAVISGAVCLFIKVYRLNKCEDDYKVSPQIIISTRFNVNRFRASWARKLTGKPVMPANRYQFNKVVKWRVETGNHQPVAA